MALMEALLLRLGGAVAKSVLSLWLGNVAVVGDVSGVAVDTVLERVPNLGMFERRRAARQFERMAEAVAEKLAPFLEAEFGGLPENERAAAVLAVTDAIEQAGISDELLLAQDLDPLRLEAHVRAAAPQGQALLVPAANVLYDHLIREACNYAVEIAVTLPPFASQAARESLRRETEIIELIHKVLSKLPEPRLAGLDGEDADARFETQYRRTLARLLDRLELFGLDVSPISKRYALSVAYITLSASDPEGDEDAEGAYVRVNNALARGRRMLVRGYAGSGKTTLLQWLAVASARHGFDSALVDWTGTVPFFVRLRRHVDGELPLPERFLDDATPSLTGAMPPGWVHRQLDSGRALVLVDGVDELPEDKRQRAREWLLDLAGTFEGARYVVTSRSTAADEDWLAEAGFRHCMLQPMTLADVDSFVDHWHDAIRTALPDEADQAELDRLGTALKATLRARPPIRSLATSPLLCAMLCALHRERSEQLPQDRMELYRVALEMLLERRDVDRRIAGSERLPLKEKQLLLRDFAYWLVLNNYIDAEQATAIERVARKLASMPRVDDDPSVAFRYLLERSGVLRAPVEGRVDFVHRTFQEYLAAAEAIEQDHVGLLTERAHLDQWREVVILAAGHATLRQREVLLRGLLQRGEREPEHRHRLHLLAVACLETSPEVPAELTAELRGVLSRLVPPKSMPEAQAVASAGQLAVPLLRGFRAGRGRPVAACVRALTLIGGDEALDALVEYGRDKRLEVFNELVRAWDSFEPIEFARRVLAGSPLRHGRFEVLTTAQLSCLHYLRNLRHLVLHSLDDYQVPLNDLEAVRGLTSLTHLEARVGNGLSDLSPLATLERLQTLQLNNCVAVGDLAPLSKLTALRSLSLQGCAALVDLAPLASLQDLRELTVSDAADLHDLSAVANLTGLRTLSLSRTAVTDLALLANLTGLQSLTLSDNPGPDLRPLANLTELRTLSLSRTAVTDLAPLANLTGLRSLNLSRTAVTDLALLANLTGLRSLNLSYTAVTDLQPLANVSDLRSLSLSHTAVTDVALLANLTGLRVLNVSDTSVADLGPLANVTGLQDLNLSRTAVTDLTPLANLRWLRMLILSGSAVTDLGPLGSRPTWIRKPQESEVWNDALQMRIR
jgi:NACHT domain